MQSDVTTESVLTFITLNASPLNFLEFPNLKFWTSSSRCNKAMIDKVFQLAKDCGFPITSENGQMYVEFFGELKPISEMELQVFLHEVFNGFGLAYVDQQTLSSCKN